MEKSGPPIKPSNIKETLKKALKENVTAKEMKNVFDGCIVTGQAEENISEIENKFTEISQNSMSGEEWHCGTAGEGTARTPTSEWQFGTQLFHF